MPVAIIGAGPVGLAAAAHALEEGLNPIIFELGPDIGASISEWGHVRLFSPWQFNMDGAAVRLLERTGWKSPDPAVLPTGHELLESYLKPLAAHPEITSRLHLNTEVLSISRQGRDKVITQDRAYRAFVLRVRNDLGEERDVMASAVIDASGTWKTPNPIGAGGVPALGEEACRAHIHYGIPDVLGRAKGHYGGRTTLVVGAGHSAANALLDLATLAEEQPETKIIWAVRGENLSRIFGGGDNDQLPARGQLGLRLQALIARGALRLVTNFAIVKFDQARGRKRSVTGHGINGTQTLSDIDRVIATTGARPNLNVLREVRVELDSAVESVLHLAPLIDPNVHSCGTVRPHGALELAHPEPGFFIVGMKSYGRAPTFLMTTGYEQVRSVLAALVGDMERALDVQLKLPETGVCSSDIASIVCCEGGQDTPIHEFAKSPQTDRESVPAGKPQSACGCGCS